MGKLSDLLRWKKSLTLVSPDGKEVETIWLRVISDYDLAEAYKMARVASANKRERLRDVDSTDHKDEVLAFNSATEDECKALIRAANENAWTSQALSTVVRGDEVKLSEVAIDPDAPTLEEQEKVDKANKEVDEEYQKALEEFVESKRKELEGKLNNMTLEEMRMLAMAEATVLLPITTYYRELTDEKTWRGVYRDKEFTQRGFDSVEDFREMLEVLREQIIVAYAELEAGLDDLKN